MCTRYVCFGAFYVLSLTALVFCGGCSKDEASTRSSPTAGAAEPAESAVPDQAELEAKLAKADLLDGKADKIVTRCASCALSMDGKAEHTLKALDYTLHFCTEGCAERFGEDLTRSVLAMEIPE